MKKLARFLPGMSRVVANATPLIIFFILSKFVTTKEMGVLNYFLSVITLTGVFTDFGLPETLQRFIPQDKTKRLIFPAIVFELVLVLIGANIFGLADLMTGGRLSYGNTLLMFLILIFSSSNVITLVFNGLQRNFRTSIYFLGASLSFIVLTFVLYFLKITDAPHAFLWGRLVSWIIFTILPLYALFKEKLLHVSFKLPKRFYLFAFNSFVFVFAYAVFNQWDSILITNTLGEYANGVYKSVGFLASLPYILSVVLDTRQLPEFSKLYAQKKFEAIWSSGQKTTKYLVMLAVALPLSSIPFAHFGISLVYSQEIADNGYFYFPLIMFAVLLYVASIPSVNVLQAAGREGRVRNVALLQSAGFVVLSTILLPVYGLIVLPFILITLNSIFLLISYISARNVRWE